MLQIFLRRVRTGRCAANQRKVKSRTAEDYVRSVAQTFLALGAPDPRLDEGKKVDFRLQRQLRSYSKEDPPPDRVKPVPVQVLRRILAVADAAECPFIKCTADMISIAFFFLLRPGEYAISPSDSQPFTLNSVQLFRGVSRIDLNVASDAHLLTATFCSLTFDTQKNSVRGEVIGQAPSGDRLLCPARALARRIIHLRHHNAPPTTPLSKVYGPRGLVSVKPSDITEAIRLAVTYLGPSLGFLPQDVTARCLRAAGANALLCAGVDTDIIRLLGRWRSDEMLRYLHTQAGPVLRDFSRKMLSGGNFTLVPNQAVPTF